MDKFEFYNFTISSLYTLINKHQLNINIPYPIVKEEETILFLNGYIGLKFTRFLRESFINVACLKIQDGKIPFLDKAKMINLFWLVNQVENKYEAPSQKSLDEEAGWNESEQKMEIEKNINNIFKIENQLFDNSYRLFNLALSNSNKYFNEYNVNQLSDEKKLLINEIMMITGITDQKNK